MTTPPLSTRVLRVFGALVLVCLMGWYGPFFTAGIWHVFHPAGWVQYRGLHVRVPWPWTADVDFSGEDPSLSPQGLALKKTPYAVNRRVLSQAIFVTEISPDPGITAEQQAGAWMDTFRKTHPADSFESRTLPAVPAEAICSAAREDQHAVDVVWTCISVEGGWVANFEGNRADEPVFFDIVAQLKR